MFIVYMFFCNVAALGSNPGNIFELILPLLYTIKNSDKG